MLRRHGLCVKPAVNAVSCPAHRQPLAAPSTAATLGGARTRVACASAIGKVSYCVAAMVGRANRTSTIRSGGKVVLVNSTAAVLHELKTYQLLVALPRPLLSQQRVRLHFSCSAPFLPLGLTQLCLC